MKRCKVIGLEKREILMAIGFAWALMLVMLMHPTIQAQQGAQTPAPSVPTAGASQWIWGAHATAGKVPLESCYFRKSFAIGQPEHAQLTISADDQYEVYVNGTLVGKGTGWNRTDQYNVTKQLRSGNNLIAVKAKNIKTGYAGLAARLVVQQADATTRVVVTDATWLAKTSPLAFWQHPPYRDDLWSNARSFGVKGKTAPWSKATKKSVATKDTHREDRFTAPEGFEVHRILNGEQTGSLLAMTFDEFGRIIASREDGPLIVISDSDKDGQLDKVTTLCAEVKNCRGIESLNGNVYVTADGPEGSGLYLLKYDEETKKMKVDSCLVKFSGGIHEYGPHGIAFGPDGMIYVTIGGFARPKDDCDATGPYSSTYEGDLVQPRLEDPGQHASGVHAPGGFILRVSPDGKTKEIFAGGLRNGRDLAFTEKGDLFVHDTAMHWDEGAPWYRPTRLSHVIPGAEFGWRSGWAKWPEYFTDSLPATVDTGPGASTGITEYSHIKYPKKYRGAIFVADWTNGKIKAITLKEDGATYTGLSETFLKGDPLNVSDMAVGKDGALYFSTGGRKTPGGIYRVVWTGKSFDLNQYLGEGMTAAIRYPQLNSAWARQHLAQLRQSQGKQWDQTLPKIAMAIKNPDSYRIRALDLMTLFGPAPTSKLLLKLSQDQSDAVRGKAVDLMGTDKGEAFGDQLITMLEDDNPTVRRKACEALSRLGVDIPPKKLLPMLASRDRFEAWAARRALERIPTEQWRDLIFNTADQRAFIQGSIALLSVKPNEENAKTVIERTQKYMRGYVSDSNFVDMLRVLQVALAQGKIKAEDASGLRLALAVEFPAGNHKMNRELVRLLTYLGDKSVGNRYVEYLQDDKTPDTEKMHLAMHMSTAPDLWTSEQKLAIFRTLEKLGAAKGGNSVEGYLAHATNSVVDSLDDEGCRQVLVHGDQMPGAALGVLRLLKGPQDPQILTYLRSLDRRVAKQQTNTARLFGVGVIGLLAENGGEESMSYLREIFDDQPERREMAAIGLAQSPEGENWNYLIKSLPVVEGQPAMYVLSGLLKSERRPTDPEPFRQVILQGSRLGEAGGSYAISVLERWTDERPAKSDDKLPEALKKWQTWFAKTWPDQPSAKLPENGSDEKWSATALLSFLDQHASTPGAMKRGEDVFAKASCTKCHQCEGVGSQSGPNLTRLASRVNRKQIIESMLYPSHVISGDFPTRRFILTSGRATEGLATAATDGNIVLLKSNGNKVTIKPEQIGDISNSSESVMPRGLLDKLTPDEIADLFAYLTSSGARVTTIPRESPK